MANADPKQLVKVLSQYYSTSELQSMCFDLGIDYEDLSGQGKSGKARELVQFAQRRGRLDDIVAYVQETRGDVVNATATSAPSQPSAQPTSVIHNYYGSVNQQQGDTINMSGNFSGSNVNVKSTLKDVNQTIGALPIANEAQKAELQQLIAQLNATLQQAPPEKAEEADAVVQMTEALVETAASEKPNKMMMQITGEGLKQAAENLAGVVPNVVKIAGAIVTGILGLA